MYIPDIELHQPAALGEACELLGQLGSQARVLAGGTDLLVDLKTGRVSARHLVSINRLDGIRGVSANNGGLRIGAMTTANELSAAGLVRERFATILDATRNMASLQIRNAATVGGNITSAVPCADLPPILTVMNASAVLSSPSGQREVPLDSFFMGPRCTALGEGELLTAINVPQPPPRFGSAYERFALRNGNAIAVASVAAGLCLNEDGTIRDARIVLGAVAPTPKLIRSVESILVGERAGEHVFNAAATEAMKAAEPIADIRGSAEFRRKLIGVLTRRALATACKRAEEAVR